MRLSASGCGGSFSAIMHQDRLVADHHIIRVQTFNRKVENRLEGDRFDLRLEDVKRLTGLGQ